ncbi:hypothetical protein NG819_20330 [Pseudarthrobacter sp. Fe7]|nr:hypothetical protein NG819_20330 [Pseudarthrobacter sp. Fe7]
MTSENNAQQDDGRAVDAMLAEAGFPDDPELRQVLLQLRGFRTSRVPTPSSALAELLQGSDAAGQPCFEPGKSRKKKRVVFTTLAVAASFGVAGGAAAGGGDIRPGVEGSICTVVEWFLPAAPAVPAPAVPARAPTPATAVVSDPAAGGPGTATEAQLPAAGLQENQEPAPHVPEVRAKTEEPVDTDGQASKTAVPGSGATPAHAGPAVTPRPDGTEGVPVGTGNRDRQDLPGPPPVPTAKAEPLRVRRGIWLP